MKQQNHNISHDFYVKMLNKTVNKPYSIRFYWMWLTLFVGSIFGNVGSIFLAYFFFNDLFSSSMIDMAGTGTVIGIVTFLTIFELLKRYIFDLFSLEYLKVGKQLFNKKMTSFIISTVLLISLSFFFSMTGAQKFMNKQDAIITQKQQMESKQIDSIVNYYEVSKIQSLREERAKIQDRLDNIDKNTKGWNMAQAKDIIKDYNEQIQNISKEVSNYEAERDSNIAQFKKVNAENIDRTSEKNKMDIIWFVIVSAIIEFLILIGVYYNKYYTFQTVVEYEREVANSPNYKKWLKAKEVLELIFETGIQPEDQISSTNEILELIKINEHNISKNEVENAFKVFGHLKIYSRVGNKRVLKMKEEDSFLALKNHFKIK